MKKILALTLAVGTLAVSGIAIARYTDKNDLGSMTPTNKEATASNPQSGKQITASKGKNTPTALTKKVSAAATKATTSISGTTAQFASVGSGVIGTPDGRVSDNPEDNLFEIALKKVSADTRAWLVYDLKGVSSGAGISRSINDRMAVGGYLTEVSQNWKTVREEINPLWLKKGRNTVLFTIPSNATYSYTVKNVRIETAPASADMRDAIVLSTVPVVYGGQTYVHGFVRGNVQKVSVSGKALSVRDGEFEGIIPTASKQLTLEIGRAHV